MKQLLFLLLFPCFAMAQYPGNANQKITLGEQTTADGLVYRGVAYIDTVTATSKITRANKQDTSAFLLLDTVTNLLWHYKTANNGWTQAGGSTFDTTTLNLVSRFALKLNISDTSSMLTNYYRSGRALGTPTSGILTNATGLSLTTGVTGTLPVANGGTGQSTLAANKVMVGNGTSGVLTPSNLHWDNINSRLGINTSSPQYLLDVVNSGSNTIRVQNSLNTSDSYLLAQNTLGSTLFGINAIGGYIYNGAALPILFYTSATEQMRITSGGLVGIGRTPVNATLEIKSLGGAGSVTEGMRLVHPSAAQLGNGTGITIQDESQNLASIWAQSTNASSTTSKLFFGASTTGFNAQMTIQSDGNVGIGTASPQSGYRLHVVDSVYVGGNVSASAYTTRSDYDLKDEIQNISYGINEVMQMQPVKYTYKSNGSTQLGFIAQDLGVITPEVVSFEDKMSVYYNALIPILTKAIQEQQALIKALEQRILNLENK